LDLPQESRENHQQGVAEMEIPEVEAFLIRMDGWSWAF